MDIGKRIKQVAEDKKVSVIELARKLAKSRQAIYDIYSGKVSVNFELLEKIALALDEPIERLVAEDSKLAVDRQALLEIIVEILQQVLSAHYVHIADLQALGKEVHDHAREGEALVHLRYVHQQGQGAWVTDYRKLGRKLNESDLARYADQLLDDFFHHQGPLGDRLGLKSLIREYTRERGEGFIQRILT